MDISLLLRALNENKPGVNLAGFTGQPTFGMDDLLKILAQGGRPPDIETGMVTPYSNDNFNAQRAIGASVMPQAVGGMKKNPLDPREPLLE